MGLANNEPAIQPADQEIDSLLEFLEEETLDKLDLGELVAPLPNNFPNASQIFVVTSKDILNQNARNVGEALRFVPGLIFSEGDRNTKIWAWGPTTSRLTKKGGEYTRLPVIQIGGK